jgi:hypothetical protein
MEARSSVVAPRSTISLFVVLDIAVAPSIVADMPVCDLVTMPRWREEASCDGAGAWGTIEVETPPVAMP